MSKQKDFPCEQCIRIATRECGGSEHPFFGTFPCRRKGNCPGISMYIPPRKVRAKDFKSMIKRGCYNFDGVWVEMSRERILQGLHKAIVKGWLIRAPDLPTGGIRWPLVESNSKLRLLWKATVHNNFAAKRRRVKF